MAPLKKPLRSEERSIAISQKEQVHACRLVYDGCVRVILKNNKKSLFERSGFKKIAENHHFSVQVFIK